MSSPSSSHHLVHSLQLAVQSLQWTYSLFWHLNPQQGVLVWGDGYYNGTIKTRKTVQPMEVSTEDAALQRSRQLRELYEALSAGETNPPARRPCAALSPEDLTETEWFYLMCVSFSFHPGLGLPGKAFGSQRHVWLTRANETDSKTFSRAILAKSAGIQTVVCIPINYGVVELGTTELVEEDLGLIEHMKNFFLDNSISNLEQQQPLFNFQDLTIVPPMSVEPENSNRGGDEDDGEDEDDENDDDEEDDNMDDETEAITDSEAMAGRCKPARLAPMVISEPSELMQLDLSEEIRLGSPDECSDNLDSELQIFGKHYDHPNQSDTYQAWQQLHEDLCNSLVQPSGYSGTPQIEEIAQEDENYSETVVTILNHNSSRMTDYGVTGYLAHSKQSAFKEWKCDSEHRYTCFSSATGRSQLLLKYILFNVPKLHIKPGGSRFLKGTQQEELSANHVLAERRRREKLNERFIILRSLVPCVTKMDKASILGDTIEYVKQLRKRIQDLESRNKKMESDWRSKEHSVQLQANSSSSHSSVLPEKRKLRVTEVEGGIGKSARVAASTGTNLQVSFSGTDALLNFQCAYRDGLMFKIMQTLDELQLEVTSVQSSVTDGVFAAEMRAKVRDREMNGKKVSILEVKKALHQIFKQY